MVGAASLKEKEMVASLFCKLANLMRLKMVCFGSDTKVRSSGRLTCDCRFNMMSFTISSIL